MPTGRERMQDVGRLSSNRRVAGEARAGRGRRDLAGASSRAEADGDARRGAVSAEMAGIAVECSSAGALRRVLWDDLGVAAAVARGDAFESLVRGSDAARAARFIARVSAGEILLGCDLLLRVRGQETRCRFYACRLDRRGLLVVGTTGGMRPIQMLEHLLRVGGQQAARLQALLGDSQCRLREAAARNVALLQEIGVLRDEIARFGRENARSTRSTEPNIEVGGRAEPESIDSVDCLRALVSRRDALARSLPGDPGETAATVDRLTAAASILLEHVAQGATPRMRGGRHLGAGHGD
jgi:hypothetical protein